MSILTHSPAIVRDGLILCLDAGAVRSYPGTGPELVSNGNFESSFTNYWTIRAGQTEGNQVLTQDSSIVKSGTYSAKIVVGGSSPNYDGMKSDSSGNFTLTNGKRYLFSFDVYPVNDTGIDAYIVAGSTYCGQSVTGLTQAAWNNVELFIDVTATSSSSFVEFQTGSAWGDGTWYFDNVSVREVLWNDLSGNFNHGTLVNAPAFSAESGAGGTKSFDFDGTSDKISMVTASIAVHCFQIAIRWDDVNSKAAVGFTADGVHFNGLTIGPWTGTMDDETIAWWGYGTGAGSGAATYIKTVVSTDWHIITANWTGSTSTGYDIWIDGVKQTVYARGGGSGHSGLLDGVTAMHIGWNEGWNNYLNGRIAFVRAYNRSLTDTEIQQNYRTHKGRFGK